jgi:hypothetical protein
VDIIRGACARDLDEAFATALSQSELVAAHLICNEWLVPQRDARRASGPARIGIQISKTCLHICITW